MSSGSGLCHSTVYISNLPYSLTTCDIHQLLESYGKIVKVTVVRNKSTRRSNGIAFVLFVQPKGALACVNGLNNTEVGGRKVNCKMAYDNGRSRQFTRRRDYPDKSRCYECGETGHLSYTCANNTLGPRTPPLKRLRVKKKYKDKGASTESRDKGTNKEEKEYWSDENDTISYMRRRKELKEKHGKYYEEEEVTTDENDTISYMRRRRELAQKNREENLEANNLISLTYTINSTRREKEFEKKQHEENGEEVEVSSAEDDTITVMARQRRKELLNEILKKKLQEEHGGELELLSDEVDILDYMQYKMELKKKQREKDGEEVEDSSDDNEIITLMAKQQRKNLLKKMLKKKRHQEHDGEVEVSSDEIDILDYMERKKQLRRKQRKEQEKEEEVSTDENDTTSYTRRRKELRKKQHKEYSEEEEVTTDENDPASYLMSQRRKLERKLYVQNLSSNDSVDLTD